MTRTTDGVLTIVAESRFQLTDEQGVSHLFILGHKAAAETSQLAPLQHRQARIRVQHEPARNTIARVATAIFLLD